MRVALYLRRSTNDDLQADSLTRAYADRYGHIVSTSFADSASGPRMSVCSFSVSCSTCAAAHNSRRCSCLTSRAGAASATKRHSRRPTQLKSQRRKNTYVRFWYRWLVDDLLYIAFKYAWPRAHRAGIVWAFTFTGERRRR